MKKILLTIVVLALSTSVFAVEPGASGNVTTVNTDIPVTSNTGVVVDASNHSVATGSDLSKAVGMAAAPALTTTLTETCMGSTSAGAGFSGGSFSFGTTWRDTECVNRLNAREVKTFGDVQAAKEILCANDNVRESFKRVGRPCVLDGGSYEQALVATPVAAPVVEQTVAPATDATVHDDQDEVAQRNTSVLQKAEEARAAMRAKGY